MPPPLLRDLPRFLRQLVELVQAGRMLEVHRFEWTTQAVLILVYRYAGSPEKSIWPIST